jgi:murein DD-endopeptidase MepM/ murein hydrolase activator NlpD
LKRWILPLAVSLGLSSLFVTPALTFAGPTADQIDKQLSELKKQQSSLAGKAADAKNQIGTVKKEKEEAGNDIETLLSQIDLTNTKLAGLNDEVEEVTADLKENVNQLELAEDRVKARDQLLRTRLRLMYTSGTVSYLDVLMSSTGFTDFLDRLYTLQSIVNQDKDILDNNIRDRDLINKKKQEVEQQLAQVKDLYQQTEEAKQDLLVQEKQKEVKIASLSKKEKELEEISESAAREVTQLAAKEAELMRQKTAASAYTYSGGKLGYPLPKVVPITSGYGSRVDPITGQKGAFHQGLDLGAPKNTQILAAEDGVVIVAGWTNGYGNTVIIDHGKGLWTLYGHIINGGIKVKKGQVVKRGQNIALVGMTGRATGYHLHFEVRLNGDYTDPKPYLNLK